MTLNKGNRRQTWLINLLIGMLLVLGGLGLYGLAQAQASLDTIYAQRVVAMAQLAQNSASAKVAARVQQQADKAREDLADAARLHGRLRAGILLTIVLGIGCAAAYGSAMPEAESAKDSIVLAPAPLPTGVPVVVVSEPPEDWDGSNRRGPNRARNVARIPKTTAPRAMHDDRREATDDWEPF